MNFCFLAIFFIGLFKLKKNTLNLELICILCLYCIILPFIVGTTQIDYHPYYFLGISPILAYVISQGIQESLENKLLITSLFVFLIVGIIINLILTIPSKILMAGLFLPFIFYGIRFLCEFLHQRNKEVWCMALIFLTFLMTPVISKIFLKTKMFQNQHHLYEISVNSYLLILVLYLKAIRWLMMQSIYPGLLLIRLKYHGCCRLRSFVYFWHKMKIRVYP